MKRFLIPMLLCLLFSLPGSGVKQYIFSNLSLKEGLSQLTVSSIYQDNQGFMWFGTRNGLNRYDGYRFEVFLNKPNDPHSLSNNHILAIIQDHRNSLWIGTNEGLNRLDLSTNRITRYFHEKDHPNSLSHNMINALFLDKKKNLWIGTGSGLNLYREASDDFEPVNPDGLFLQNPIHSISETEDQRLVLGTKYQGVVLLEKKEQRYESLVFKNNPQDLSSLSSNEIRSVFVDSRENIWIGTVRNGINFLKSTDSKNPQAKFRHLTQENGLSNNIVRGINESPGGEIVIGTANGLNVINPISFQVDRYNAYGSHLGNLSHYSIIPVFFDRNQTLWVGTYAGGIDYANPYGNRFRNFDIDVELKNVTGIIGPMVESGNDLYITTEGGGLLQYDNSKDTFRQHRLVNSSEFSYADNILKSLCEDKGKILCGTTAGTVYSFDPKTGKFTLLQELKEKTPIYVLQRDSEGNLIIGGVNHIGLTSVNPQGKIQKSYPVQDASNVEFYDVRSFLEVNPGEFLIGTRNEGLFLYNKKTKNCRQYKKTAEEEDGIPENYIVCLLKDSRGRVWIGSFGGGISLFDIDKETFTTYNTDSGLLDNSICSLVESPDGHLWVSSISGLSDFDTDKQTFTNYTSRNGINIREFSLQSGTKTRNGSLFFGGNSGLVSFKPGYLDINPFAPPVVLENLYINNELIVPGRSPLLSRTLGETREIRLSHNQSNLSIEYAALNYLFPERNQYAYTLEGFDEEWTQVENRRRAYYTNLSPGKYTFRVKASNNDGIWNEEGTALQITILPPLWKTWWAYTIYTICFFAIVFFIIRYFKERERLKNDIRQKQLETKTQQEFHEARNRLFTNFSHELRTPLTLIMSPLDEIIEQDNVDGELKNRLHTMQSNSHRLLRLVNNLMDFQKNESGMLRLLVSKEDIVGFIREMTLLFSEMASSREIELHFHSSEDRIECWYDKSLMEKVLFNLFSNAFKNTPNRGRIHVILNKDNTDNSLLIEISNTGNGIAADDLEKIFIPFYQVSQTEHARSGTGLGLSLSKSIIELHHGKVWAESDGESYATFRFIIPLSENLFEDDERANESNIEESIYHTIEIVEQEDTASEQEETPTEISYTILIVEDNPDVRKYLKSRLASSYQILEAGNGEEGLTKAFNYMPDMVLTDLMMPKMDGMELCLKLKTDVRTSHIPVIMITAKTMTKDIFRGYETGADDYITKPFSISLLKIRIKNILQAREKLKERYGKDFSLKTLGVKANSLDEQFIQKLYKFLEQEIANPDLDVSDFYQELGLSRSNLYRKISAITNLTPGELIRNFRLETAKKLLAQPDVSISEVYVAVGFNSHSYFSNCFKATYGLTPSEYAKGGADEEI